MSVSVWADVGGTFTDCLVHEGGRCRQTKVLSSGLIRATAKQVSNDTTLHLDDLPCKEIDGFWIGASLSVLSNSERQEAAIIVEHSQETLTLDRKIAGISPGAQLELDANLDAPVLATRLLLGVPLSQPLPHVDVRMGTTRGTNALLTRQGANTATLVTSGFADLLRIGEQDRPDLFALAIEKPAPLTDTVTEVSERLDSDGNIILPLDTATAAKDIARLKKAGFESLAICLLHSHVNDEHERQVEQLARDAGFENVSRSSEVAPLIKLVSRAETTTLDAYLNPILAGYVARVWQQFGGTDSCRLRLMTSGGNLVAPNSFRGRDSILSGPAGGVVALGHVARRAKTRSAIGLDMGGTSTDVSRYEGSVGRRYESRVAGVRVMTPMMDIETVAAGGGSICGYSNDQRLVVGPASAGADPGPACYGRGGPLTVTDVNLLLGRIPESRFPFPLDRDAAQREIEQIQVEMQSQGATPTLETLAEGFLDIAITHMAEAVRTVSTAQGSDVRSMALVGFGGAAGQHLCRVAQALGMRRILDHPESGMLSALGMGLAEIGRVVTRGIYKPVNDFNAESFAVLKADLCAEADRLLEDELGGDGQIHHTIQVDLRYQGTESALSMSIDPVANLAERFHDRHHETFGYAQRDRSLELVAIRCDATLPSPHRDQTTTDMLHHLPTEKTRMWHGAEWIDAAMLDRASLARGETIEAPAMIVGPHSTLIVEPGWQGNVIDDGIIELTPTSLTHAAISDEAVAIHDPVLLEVVARRLQGIADAMGEVLRRTSISVNVKERRDYSCAVFRGDGSLIANAPHVPVHLGAMGHTVRRIRDQFPTMSPHDCYLSNDPFAGGSHLPDVTVVSPVFCDATITHGTPDFFVASRAHHAEIGGRTPGSMPPDATNLAEEGVVIRDFALVKAGISYTAELETLLSSGPYPSRCVVENLADIAAQQAAGTHGARALVELTKNYSTKVIDSLMGRILEIAGDSMQRWIQTLPLAPMKFEDQLDDGSRIACCIERVGLRLRIQFETAPVHPHGFNATPAIVTAAVLYVLRSVSQSDMPLCDGVLRDVTIEIPEGILDPPADEDPAKCAAVVAGNVETSQRVVDVLLGALEVAAASQGTMNNVLMGDETFGYYETIGGGSGAMASRPGADAVHTHMTNTRITDPEILETRLPVRLRRFAIRRNSGGAGKFPGGNGIIREFEFLRPLVVSLLTSRRTRSPYGAAGGEPGTPGKNLLIRRGETTELAPTGTHEVETHDRLVVETPGGGGWGSPDQPGPASGNV
ncbi:MAG: hydantoinase B/oxoprolinase family protein [Rubripirellula sp.]